MTFIELRFAKDAECFLLVEILGILRLCGLTTAF